MKNRMKPKNIAFVIGCLILVFMVLLSLRTGSSSFTQKEFISGITARKGYERITFVIVNLRLPRMICAVLAGIGLSVSGMALQNITGNDLAGPNIIGVNAGAGFAVIAGMYLFPSWTGITPLFAFLGAFLATVVILAIGNALSDRKNAIILAGVAITALLNAYISLISIVDTDILAAYTDFSVGGLSGSGIKDLIIPGIMICLAAVALLYFSKDIDALMLGDDIAGAVGVNCRFVKTAVILLSSAAAGAVVSFAGLLGFVGVIVPHMSRRIFGTKTKAAALGSVLIGANLVLFADTIGRTVFPGTEIPVGIVMAFIGVPFFLYLIFWGRTA